MNQQHAIRSFAPAPAEHVGVVNPAIQNHDAYGKRVLRTAAGPLYREGAAQCRVDLGAGLGATIDGVVAPDIAVEIEARVAKQVRGALLDLICHRYPKKLLILMPVWARNPELTARQCRHILGRFVPADDFRVVVLAGKAGDEQLDTDIARVRSVLAELATGELRP